MNRFPMYRPSSGKNYYSKGKNNKMDKKCNSANQQDGNLSSDEGKDSTLSPVMSHRTRAASSTGYEGLIIDRSPEETERISKKLSCMLDNRKGANSILDTIKEKVLASKDDQGRRSPHGLGHGSHTHCPSVPVTTTTIITRHHEGGISSDSALADHHQHDSQEELPTEMYSFVVDDPEKAYMQFMQAHRCYDVIPMNSKLVILDVNLDVRKAFYALVYNSVRSALLWNSKKERLCGMLTITDFILILLRLYRTDKSSISKKLEEELISEWRDILKKEGKLKKLTTITAGTSLFRAVQVLIDTKYHRIPVVDEITGNPLYFLTHKRILRFLYLYLEQLPRPPFMNETIRELNVGTFRDLQFVHPDTPLAECLDKLTIRHMSAVPVIERDTHKVVDIYARFDAIGLATQQTYGRLDSTVAESLHHRKEATWYEGVLTCLETDKLWEVVTKLVMHEVHGLVVVDTDNVLKGVLTLSDVLRFMVLQPIMEKSEEKTSL